MTNLVVHNPIEITGNIIVHHPIKREAEVIPFPEPVWEDKFPEFSRWLAWEAS